MDVERGVMEDDCCADCCGGGCCQGGGCCRFPQGKMAILAFITTTLAVVSGVFTLSGPASILAIIGLGFGLTANSMVAVLVARC